MISPARTIQELLGSFCSATASEQGGAISQRGFDYQISYTIDLLTRIHDEDADYFLVIDHLDDIVIITKEGHHFYQVKTKKSGSFSWNDILKIDGTGSFASKMYGNILKFPEENVRCTFVSSVPFKVREQGKKTLGERDTFRVKDLTREERHKFYEHVQETHKVDIEALGKSVLVEEAFVFTQSDFNLRSHEDAIIGRFHSWLERSGFPSFPDNKFLYQIIRRKISVCGSAVVGQGKSIEDKIISRTHIAELLANHATQSDKELIDETATEVGELFPASHAYMARGILIRHFTELLNPNNIAARTIKEQVPSLLMEEIRNLPPKLQSLPARQVAVHLVSRIDQRLPSGVTQQYQDKTEREIMILLEMNRAKKLPKPPTTRPESKKENS